MPFVDSIISIDRKLITFDTGFIRYNTASQSVITISVLYRGFYCLNLSAGFVNQFGDFAKLPFITNRRGNKLLRDEFYLITVFADVTDDEIPYVSVLLT
ncbi:hypothetical protein CE143_00990 [Photorhabdus luminescens]|uniref:Uncharacterized protein n=1 Tax=Photorhabdus akhurstii TaxID=171438 RepID=A0ABX8LQS7_9GAMM|nr:hypothetical protein B0X70_00990 [Photorhabdus akhurstii]UJD73705.1 hypothetical protein CE143_00990 [Photorhabdus luminescens]